MLNTNFHTFLVTFTNTNTRLIFQNTHESVEKLTNEISKNGYIIDKFYKLNNVTRNFRNISRDKVRAFCDFSIEFYVLF